MNEFYTSIETAIIDLMERRKSLELQRRVRNSLKLTPELEVLQERPHLVMFRQVLTPLTETLLLFELANEYKLTPFIIEYYEDKVVSTGNQFKRGLGKLPIHQFKDAAGTDVFQYKTVIDFNTYTGKPLNNVFTIHNEKLIDLHHRLFFDTINKPPALVSADGTKWFKKYPSAHEYYVDFLKVFVRDAILFENFNTSPHKDDFLNKTVLPAYNIVHNEFNHKPLIANIYSQKTDHTENYWDHYPKEVGELLRGRGYS